MAVNQLGEFTFVTLHNPQDRGAPPLLPAIESQVLQRPGVDGTLIQRTGKKAQPFDMRSGVDVQNFSVANDLLAEYLAIQNDDARVLIWGGVNYSLEYSVLYVVLRVVPIRIRRISAATGGLTPYAEAWLEALWTLQPVKL